jgi:hypothetical protein
VVFRNHDLSQGSQETGYGIVSTHLFPSRLRVLKGDNQSSLDCQGWAEGLAKEPEVLIMVELLPLGLCSRFHPYEL